MDKLKISDVTQAKNNSVGPWFKFWVDRYLADYDLRACSPAARGLYIDLQCLMHRSEKYGVLIINGDNQSEKNIQKGLGYTPKKYTKYLGELIAVGKIERDADGNLYCPQLIKDKKVLDVSRAAGKEGARRKKEQETGGDTLKGTLQDSLKGTSGDTLQLDKKAEAEKEEEKEAEAEAERATPQATKNPQPFRSASAGLKKISKEDVTAALRSVGIGELEDLFNILCTKYGFTKDDIKTLYKQANKNDWKLTDFRRALDSLQCKCESSDPPRSNPAYFYVTPKLSDLRT